ncbi:MAG: tRNA (guanosine(37)-N1)-methyltransferase TrmD [Phycisphaeraceae bacterium]|nr:tRNA (guanosine(37)-N1)-methyltransferase TrmD [Phycisphaeraceae bacterium]
MAALRIDILTLFPEVFEPVLGASITGRARAAGVVEWRATNIRDFADNKHKKVDDRPFGGGPGMVMMCQPLFDAVRAVEAEDPRPATRILLTPQGAPLTQALVEELARRERLLLIAGHYEGIDERVIEELAPLEVSVGDFVLSGGEIPALALIDAVVRLLPGALGHDQSAAEDSFMPTGPGGQRLLDCPHYTRPREWNGRAVPEVLMSGDHGKVDRWRLEQKLERTRSRRPDLLEEPSKPAPGAGQGP